MRLIYIAGPYRSKTEYGVHQNIRAAEDAAVAIWRMGAVAISPHKNTAYLGGALKSDDIFIQGDLEILNRCDAVMFLPGWETSSGCNAEMEHAKGRGKAILFSVNACWEWLKNEHFPLMGVPT